MHFALSSIIYAFFFFRVNLKLHNSSDGFALLSLPWKNENFTLNLVASSAHGVTS